MRKAKIDKIQGKLKEAAGTVTGDEKLKREGQAQQVVGEVKDAVDSAVKKVKGVLKGE